MDCFSTVDKGSLVFAADDPNGVGDLHDRVLAEGGLMLAVEDVTFAFEEKLVVVEGKRNDEKGGSK